MNIKTPLIFLFNLLLITSSVTFAQSGADPVKEDPDKGLPKSGILSSTYSTGSTKMSVAIPWNKKGASADSDAPLSGSVSRISQKQWKMIVNNNSEDDFNASVVLRQLNSSAQAVKSDSFSLRLKAKSSAERIVSALSNSLDAELELLSWKRIVKAAPNVSVKAEEQSEIQKPILQAEQSPKERTESTSQNKRKIRQEENLPK